MASPRRSCPRTNGRSTALCASSASSATTSTGCSTWPRTRSSCCTEVRQEYDRFIAIVTQAVERARAGQIAEARELQLRQARPLADRLERLTNQLVNVAEADMLERIEASQQAYDTSRKVVVGLALASIVLALGLGYVFSWSIVGPLTQIDARLRQIASGDFEQTGAGQQPRRARRARRRRQPDLRGAGAPLRADRGADAGAAARRSSGRPRPRGAERHQPVDHRAAAGAGHDRRHRRAALPFGSGDHLGSSNSDGTYHLAAAYRKDEGFCATSPRTPSLPGGEQ